MDKFFLNVLHDGTLGENEMSAVKGGAASCVCNGEGTVFTCKTDDCKCDNGASYCKGDSGDHGGGSDS